MGVEGTGGGRRGVDRLSIRPLDDGAGLKIDDRIERRHCEIATGGTVSPAPLPGNPFRYPVDSAVQVETDWLAFGGFSRTFVHGAEPTVEVGHFDERAFGPGRFELELSGPVKLYVAVTGPMRVETSVTDVEISLEEARTVSIGARSYHERPATTVRTTDDPTDVMAAVSSFGSALKTTRSERSYPTLRGHPPALKLADELSVPDGVEPPSPDVTLEVPPSLRQIVVVSPLAYYLGARVEEGPGPRLIVDGESVGLESDQGFEAAVERTLKKTFLLDCLVRTAGPQTIPLHERRELEGSLDVDLGDLYGRPGAERLRAYAEAPYDAIDEYLPTWKLTAHVEPTAASLEALPFLVADLAVVRTRSDSETGVDGASLNSVAESSPADPLHVEPPSPTVAEGASDHHVQFETDDSLEQAWVGRGTPIGASKAVPAAYRNRLDRTAREEEIEIVVVCNDDSMLDERDSVEAAYGTREEFPVDVTFYEDLTAAQLSFVLESDVDFLHYIGHVDDDGFRCRDGVLDAASLSAVGIDIFFLNACRSYRQGRRLIERGAISGVVTVEEITNSGAIRIGKALAELLDYGFPLRSALNVARDRSVVGSQYLVVGDGNADIAQAETGSALLADVSTGGDDYELDVTAFPTNQGGMGSQFRPAVPGVDGVFLCPGTLPTFEVSRTTLREYFETSVFPVRFDGEFTWTDRVDLSDATRR